MEGFLNKQGDKGLVLNLWRKRWFQLDLNSMRIYYYKSKTKEDMQGYINLLDASGVDALDPQESFSFVVHTRDREWKLAATSEIDKQAWMNAIESALNAKKSDASAVSFADHSNRYAYRLETNKSPRSKSYTGTRKQSEDAGIFEFEGDEFGSANNTRGDSDDEQSKQNQAEDFDENYAPPAPPNPTPKEDRSFLCGSLPVNVPKLASTWQANRNWTYSDSEDSDKEAFERPDEMAAKTYKEISLATGIDFNAPQSYSKRLTSFL